MIFFWGGVGADFFRTGMGYPILFLIGGGGVFAFFKLTSSGGHQKNFGGGGGSVKKCLPPSPSD